MADEFSGLACGCGAQRFRRVLIERPGRQPHVTVLAECLACHAAFVCPPEPQREPTKRPAPKPRDLHAELMAEVESAARGYVKPGRQPKSGYKRAKPVR